ncbi:hypothetical protein SAMN06265349_101476 [Flavobacterium resistens]|uniref:Uncharacterized protein n=1 Tax=Flavobacterium resistens TaxID=443612 RepID=A0A521AWV8_9FLAO|nr:hypothetical protein [Flavobacterium resistens]MRX68508.1 hypothetical protein [Flavobacterium resistens]SMO39201.1 hypothetical protein SAMN06265349_101476 [Flavobacterium resistens]
MNRIKFISTLSIAVILLLTSCSKDDYKLGGEKTDPFLRFNFMTKSDNIPLEYPAINANLIPKNSFENKSVKTLKVPVALTSFSLKNAVTAYFSATTTGSSDGFSVNPKTELSFLPNKLNDTIYVSFDKRWKENQSITLKLESASDPDIHIGNLNTEALNDTFRIDLGTISTNYTFPISKIDIKGIKGEVIDFKVNFPNGFFPSEIDNLTMFKFLNGFEYQLTHDDYGNNRSSITYHLTLLEDIQNDDVYYESTISLNNTTDYPATGNTILQIVKPIKSPRDILANPASKFYDLSNQFYLTYGENWFDKSGTCAWQAFNAFTFPVVVSKDNPNAILYSDKGTTNPNDDIYHDAFKIGFNVASGTSTTNSFNLKRWFTNESTAGANSPGFNITSALEFFPDNGNSKTAGKVLVIPQFITIASTTKNSHIIAISGEGTYKEISTGLFEISFELRLTNDELFGGTATSQYKIYNNKTYPKLNPINEPCAKEVAL